MLSVPTSFEVLGVHSLSTLISYLEERKGLLPTRFGRKYEELPVLAGSFTSSTNANIAQWLSGNDKQRSGHRQEQKYSVSAGCFLAGLIVVLPSTGDCFLLKVGVE